VTDVRVKPEEPNVVTAAVGWRRGKALDADGKVDSQGIGLCAAAPPDQSQGLSNAGLAHFSPF